MVRILFLAIVLLSLGQVLLLNWGMLALHGRPLSALEWLAGGALVWGVNFVAFPVARRSIHAEGLSMVFSRTWILGSVAAMLTGLLLALVFLLVGGGGRLLDAAGVELPWQDTLVWVGGAVVCLGFGSVLWGSTVGNARVRVDPVSLPLPRVVPELAALRMAHVTDLHIGPLMRPPRLRELVDRINALEPDLVFITGDIFDFDAAYVEAGCRELAKLSPRHGVFAVLGNHDVYTGAEIVSEGIERLTEARLLRNHWERLDIGGHPLIIAGIEDPGDGWTEHDSEHAALDRLAREIPEDEPCLLLAHRPSYFHHAARLGFPLILSGHTHGGQVAPPLAHNHNPSRLISRWTRGRFHHGDSVLYVNRGLGMAGLPLRINCPREIALIRLLEAEAFG